MAKRGFGRFLTVLLVVLACGGKSEDTPTQGGSSGGSVSASGGATSGGMTLGGATSGGSLTTSGGFVATGGIAAGGQAGSSSGSGSGNGSSTGAASGNGDGSGCPGFAIALDPGCEACRISHASCRVEESEAATTCPSVYSCVARHCSFLGCSSSAGCEGDTCSCIAPCLPEGVSPCRDAWERWMACNKLHCEAEC